MTDGVNIHLLRKAVEWAEAEAAQPFETSRWFQGHFILDAEDAFDAHIRTRLGKSPECGTCYCIAGYVADLANVREPIEMRQVATDELGLTDHQGNELFAAHNTIADVRRIAEDIAGEPL